MSLRMKLINNKIRWGYNVADYYFDGRSFSCSAFSNIFYSLSQLFAYGKEVHIDKVCILKDIFRDKDPENRYWNICAYISIRISVFEDVTNPWDYTRLY